MDSSAYHRAFSTEDPYEIGHTYRVKFETQPFAAGICRHAFKGTVHGQGPKVDQMCVVKAPKNLYAKEFDSWVPDIAASKMANKYAEKFNSDCIPLLPQDIDTVGEMNIKFLLPLIAKVEHVAHNDESYVRRNSYVLTEHYLDGKYHKFNNNYGYEDDSKGVLLAFTHWTYIISGRIHIICDLQGVETPGGYILTDPAVLSLEQLYGPTDLGVKGMKSLLQSHICSIHCKALGIDSHQNQYVQDTKEQVHHTKYLFQLTEEKNLRAKKKRSELFSRIPSTFGWT